MNRRTSTHAIIIGIAIVVDGTPLKAITQHQRTPITTSSPRPVWVRNRSAKSGANQSSSSLNTAMRRCVEGGGGGQIDAFTLRMSGAAAHGNLFQRARTWKKLNRKVSSHRRA